MVACFQAMHAHPVTRLVRVPWNEPGIIGKVLDGGNWAQARISRSHTRRFRSAGGLETVLALFSDNKSPKW